MSSLQKAASDGTETVTVTYALCRLTVTIPQDCNNAAAAQTLRKDVKAKNVAWGPALEVEAARLAAA